MRRLFLSISILLSGLLVACSSSGIRLPQSPLTAALERKSGLIAFVGPDGNVYTIDQGGGNLTMLTDDAHPMEDGVSLFYQYPTWSQRDNRLAFIRREVTEDGQAESSIFATQADAEGPIEIFASREQHPIYLYWSPSTEWVSFLSSLPGSDSLAMQLAPAAGGEIEVIDTGSPFYWDWAPHGMEVMAHVGGSAASNPEGAKLSLLQIDPVVREVGLGIQPTQFQAPAYSPDGEYVMLAGDGGGQSQLLLTNPNGIVVDSLIDFDGSVAFAWSPRDNVAAVVTAEPGARLPIGRLSFMDLRNPASPETINTEADQVLGFFWAPNGRELAYFVVQVVESEGSADGSESGSPIVFLELYVADSRSGESERIWLFRPTAPFLDMLVYFDQYQRSSTIWSPDSNYLVVPVVLEDDRQGLAIVRSSGGFEPRLLIEAQLGVWSWE